MIEKSVDKNANINSLKAGVWYTILNLSTGLLGFLSTGFFARAMPKADFGEYETFLSWQSIIGFVVTLNLDSTLISARYELKNKFDEYAFSCVILGWISTFICCLGVNLIHYFFPGLITYNINFINIIFLFLFFFLVTEIYKSKSQIFFCHFNAILTILFTTFLSSILSIVLVLVMNNKLMARIYGGAMPTIIVGIILFIKLADNGKRINISHWKFALPICLPYIPHLLSMTLLNSMDRIMVADICGSEQNADYSIAYKCGLIISILFTAMNNSYSPWLGKQLDEKNYDQIKQFSRIYVLIFTVFAVGVMLVAPEVLYILGGQKYVEAKFAMLPVTCGICYQFLYTMFVNIEQIKRKTIGMAMGSMLAALSNYVLNMIFIPKYGYIAAAFTTMASYFILMAFHSILVRLIGYAKVYDYKFIFLIAFSFAVLVIVCEKLYELNTIRAIIVCLYAMVLIMIIVLNKNRLLSLFNILKKR